MQIKHIACGIGHLGGFQFAGSPVRALLLFGDIDSEKLIAEVFQTVAVGIGADQLGGDLGAINR